MALYIDFTKPERKVINVRSVLIVLLGLLFIVSACCSSSELQESEKKPQSKTQKEYNTSEFDIWMGCKVKSMPNGQISVEALMGGNPMLFEVLLQGIEMIGQKLGFFPIIPESNDPLMLLPYDT